MSNNINANSTTTDEHFQSDDEILSCGSDENGYTPTDAEMAEMTATEPAETQHDEQPHAKTQPQTFEQQLENLPSELTRQPRFFLVGANKAPLTKDWSNPDNQKIAAQINGIAGFDTCGHGKNPDYLFLDFDHVLNDKGDFVNDAAERWYNFVQMNFCGYCERSISGHGLHILAKPSPDTFKKINAGSHGTLYLDKHDTPAEQKTSPKLEVFYQSGGRYCLLTGIRFGDGDHTKIAEGTDVDGVFQQILDEIAKQNQPAREPAPHSSKSITSPASDNCAVMLEIFANVPAKDCDYAEWRDLGMVARRVGVDFEDFNKWSAQDDSVGGDGKPRYKPDDVRYFWEHCKTADELGDGGIKIGTAIDIAKRHGYTPPPSYHAIKLPVDLHRPANVKFSGNWILVECKIGREVKQVAAARTLIIPTKRFINFEGGNLRYEIAIRSPIDEWTRAVVGLRTLLEPSKIYELAEHGANVANAKLLASYFSETLAVPENERIIPTVTVYKRTGWHGDKFIYPTPAEGDNYRVERAGIDYDSIFKARGDKDAWLMKFLEVTNNPKDEQQALKRICVGAALVAPMLEILKIPNPQINLWGTSNLAKTPLLKFGLSVFGDPSEGAMFRTWNATPKNMLTMSAGFDGLPMLVDEGETMSKWTQLSLSEYVYNFAIGIIGQANKRNGDVRATEKFRGVRLSTAEHPFHNDNDKRGAFKRMIDLHVTQELFNDSRARELHIFCERNHGHYGRLWTQYLEANRDSVSLKFEALYASIDEAGGFVRDGKKVSLNTVDATNARAVIACAVAWHQFFAFTQELPYDADRAENDAAQILAQLPTVDEISDVKRSIDLLVSWITEHPDRFIYYAARESDNGVYYVEFRAPNPIGAVGKKYRDGRIAFFTNAFRKICTEIGIPSYEKFLTDLYDAGLLECKDSRTKSRVIHALNDRVRAYVLDIETFRSREYGAVDFYD